MDPARDGVSRRDFLTGTGATLGGIVASSAFARAGEEGAGDIRVPRAVLGRTGAEVSRLGIGCAWFQRKQVTPEDVGKTLRRALELGVNYLDVAPNYYDQEGGYSEVKMGPTLKDKAFRDQVFLVTKTEEPTYEGTWRLLRQSLDRLQTDHLDLVHLHNLGDEPRWPDLDLAFGDRGALGALREAKAKGVIRFIGASGHLHPSRFHAALDTGQIDVLMNAVNFVVQHTYDFEHKVWSRAQRENIGLVAMKVLGGNAGKAGGFKLPEDHYERAICYALSIPGLSVAVIGLEDVAELEQAARVVARARPLSDQEAYELKLTGLKLAGEEHWKAMYGRPVT
jgi:aryl-alcohol dehydrogenase-like predicted oxidoreductase